MAPGILTNGQSKMFPHEGNRSIISGRFKIAIFFENVIRWETGLITLGDYFAFVQQYRRIVKWTSGFTRISINGSHDQSHRPRLFGYGLKVVKAFLEEMRFEEQIARRITC